MSKGSPGRKSRPWHLWVVGIVALVWNAGGAVDFVMTQTRYAPYMGQFTPQQLEFFYSFPAWVVALWAIAVWGSVLGAILLLLKKRAAAWVFLAALVAMVLTAIHNLVLTDGMEVMGGASAVAFTLAIFVGALLLVVYAFALVKRGVLT